LVPVLGPELLVDDIDPEQRLRGGCVGADRIIPSSNPDTLERPEHCLDTPAQRDDFDTRDVVHE
jgi:hypothetical protein